MNIVYTTDNNFVDKIATSMCSIFENNSNLESITIFLICQNVSLENQKLLIEFGKKYNRDVYIIEIEEMEKYFTFEFDTTGWSPIVLARLLLDKLLPDSVDRVLYLDGDTLILSSLKDLWNTNMDNCVIGACIEATVNIEQRINLDMEHTPYVNAGVLLINMKKWRKEGTGKRIIDFYKANDGKLFANDQDAINGALKDEIFYLEPKYNFYNIYWYYPYHVLKKLMGTTWYYSLDTVTESINHPAIIHYLGEERPWRKGNTHKFKKEYQFYLDKTPWRNHLQDEGWSVYFFCWRIFNIIVKPFPTLRYKIINGLIPTFLKWRSKRKQ